MNTKKFIGKVDVDSGCIILCDPAYCNLLDKDNGIKEVVLNKEKNYCGEVLICGLAKSVVSSTRDGDGSYPVFAEFDKDKKIKSITIRFTPD